LIQGRDLTVGALRDWVNGQQQRCWHELTGKLREAGVAVLGVDELTPGDLAFLEERFRVEASAVLTPIAVDPAHPFPFIPNNTHPPILKLIPQPPSASTSLDPRGLCANTCDYKPET
jgi:polyphosphate kinase